MKLVAGKVLVARDHALEKIGAIHLPDIAKEAPREGRVLAVGPGRRTSLGHQAEPQVSTGDRVIFSGWAGTELKVEDLEDPILQEAQEEGQTVLVMDEEDILCVVESE